MKSLGKTAEEAPSFPSNRKIGTCYINTIVVVVALVGVVALVVVLEL